MLVTIVWISNFVLVTLISFLLILVQAKSAIQEIQSNKPEITSRGSPSIPTQQDSSIFLSEEKLREIFNVTEHVNPLSYNVGGDRDKFQVQRTTSGNLEVVVNNTTISSSQSQASSSSDIIFPDDSSDMVKPKCIRSEPNFCFEVSNYPAAHLEKLLRVDLNKFDQLFGEDTIISQFNNLSQRNDEPDEDSLCHSRERVIYPQAGLTKDNTWSFIINHENRTQGIRTEECVNPGKPCAYSDAFPNGYRAECRQKYIFRQLLSINAEGHVTKELFRVPSCCKCIISSLRFKRQISKT